MSEDLVTYDCTDAVARITLTNGDHGNPLNLDSVGALREAISRARSDDAHVVLLRSSGASFCVGGDVRAFARAPVLPDAVSEVVRAFHEVVADLHALDAVVVVVVRGSAAGAGVALAAAGDVILASETARFTLAYTKVGLSPDGGSSLLCASIGLHRALSLALLNPVLTAMEAQATGLVAAVHRDDELDAAVDQVVATLLAGSRPAQVATRRLFRGSATPDSAQALSAEERSITERAAGPDGREGVDAFAGKRSPVFERRPEDPADQTRSL